MTFDPEWEAAHAARPWGQYPREELIRFVAKNYYDAPDRSAVRFLDIGCGAGASAWYLAREGFGFVAVDGSESAVLRTRERLRGISTGGLCWVERADIMKFGEPAESVDAMIDVCTLQHLPHDDAKAVLDFGCKWLRPGGRVFSVMVMEGSDLTFHTTKTHIRPASRSRVQALFSSFVDVQIQSVWRQGDIKARPHGPSWGEWIIDGRKP